MTNQEILENAPEGATHVDTEGDYHKIETIYQYEDKSDCGYEDRFRLSNSGDWVTDSDDLLLTRSLADIKRIAGLEKERDKYKAYYDSSIEKDYPKKKFPRLYEQQKALKEQDK